MTSFAGWLGPYLCRLTEAPAAWLRARRAKREFSNNAGEHHLEHSPGRTASSLVPPRHYVSVVATLAVHAVSALTLR